jgi:hypothetical protein
MHKGDPLMQRNLFLMDAHPRRLVDEDRAIRKPPARASTWRVIPPAPAKTLGAPAADGPAGPRPVPAEQNEPDDPSLQPVA